MKKYFKLKKSINWLDVIMQSDPKSLCFIDKNNGDYILAWGKSSELIQKTYKKGVLNTFRAKNNNDYIFGFLSYDIKNSLYENLSTSSTDIHNYPDSIHFVPAHVITSKNGNLEYFGDEKGLEYLLNLKTKQVTYESDLKSIKLTPKTDKKTYFNSIESIKKSLQQGDIYEMNYCIQFSEDNIKINPYATFKAVKNKTKAPFCTFFRFNEYYIISGSPERFIRKLENTLISQPIKGTAPRHTNPIEDNNIKTALINNPKEISENIMIVDLVRNDMSKIALKNSVKTPELCQLYSFETVHQLISTVECQLPNNIDFESIIQALFPMGSMTGAPKLNAMKIIDAHENFKRGIYSGSIGYITPDNDFDSNVVIRSVVYNEKLKNVSVSVGGAITIKSEVESEYNECLLKLKSIEESIKV